MRIQFTTESNLINPSSNEGKLLYADDTDNFYLCTGSSYNSVVMNKSGNVGINNQIPDHTLSITSSIDDVLILQRGGNSFEITMQNSGRVNMFGDIFLNTVLNPDSGGTGITSYALDDLVVGNSSSGLRKLAKSNIIGSMLINGKTGLEYSTHIFKKYLKMSDAIYVSNTNTTIDYVYCRNSADTDFIMLENINLSTNVDLQGNAVGGLVNPSPESTNISSLVSGFTPTTEYVVGDAITINGETRKVTNNNPLTVNAVFTSLPLWTLAGAASLSTAQFRFGTKSLLSTATTALATVLTRVNTPTLFTIECFLRVISVGATMNIFSSATANSFLIGFARTPNNFTVSIGQGASFNIANAVRLATTVVAIDTWYHFAVVRSATQYRFFINGVEQNSVTSALNMTAPVFNSFILGNSASTYNGYIDEFRLSNVSRYTANFTPTAVAFTIDSSTISLNHFDGTTVTNSDNASLRTFTHSRNTSVGPNQVLYVYAQQDKLFITPRSTENAVVDFDSGITSNDIRKIPVYYISNSSNVVYSVVGGCSVYDISPFIPIITNSTSTTAVVVSLSSIVPIDAKKIKVLITHVHVGTISAGIVVGTNANLYNTYLTTNVASNTSLIIEIPVLNQSVSAYLSVLASTTNFSLNIIGFMV
jgi:Concanavalin A-like lectin/glucanases superfamily